MIGEREIWACANLLISRHGADAWYVAAQRADNILAAANGNSRKTFMRILDRIKQLESMSTFSGLH